MTCSHANLEDDARAVLAVLTHGAACSAELSSRAALRLAAWREAAQTEAAHAMWLVGLCCELGVACQPDLEGAHALFARAAAQGYAPAALELGRLLRAHPTPHTRPEEATDWVRQAAERDLPQAMGLLGILLLDESCASARAEGASWLRRAATHGCAVAQVNLGSCYADGVGVVRDPGEAVRLYEQAAEQGHAGAMCLLGLCYEDGLGVEDDAERALSWYMRAADAGDVEAHLMLGVCWEEGIGTEPDLDQAARFYTFAARHHNAYAQLALASCLERGAAPHGDDQDAAAWFLRAAELGSAEGAYRRALCSARGAGGTPQDSVDALHWFHEAARRGHADAHYCIGVAYSRGDGVEACPATAYTWFQKAAALGSSLARDAVHMPPASDDLRALVAQLVDASRRAGATFDDAKRAAYDVLEALSDASDRERDAAMTTIARAMLDADVGRGALLALVAGALVEAGVAVELVMHALLERLPTVIRRARAYAIASHAPPLGPASGERGCGKGQCAPERAAHRVAAGSPAGGSDPPSSAGEPCDAWQTLDLWCQPAIALLSRDAEARAATSELLGEALPELAAYHPAAAQLNRLVHVPTDETIRVIEPTTRRGFELRVSGISDTFQLQTLLAEAIIGDAAPLLEGLRPSAETLACARGEGPQDIDVYVDGNWDLIRWRALRCDLRLSPVDDCRCHLLPNDASIDDIEPFDGVPTLLLAPRRIEQSWRVCRRFAALRAEAYVTSVLSESEVDTLLQRIAASADRPKTPRRPSSASVESTS